MCRVVMAIMVEDGNVEVAVEYAAPPSRRSDARCGMSP